MLELKLTPEEKRILAALNGRDVTWRTVSGVARDAQLSDEEVFKAFERFDGKLTTFATVPSASGSPLVGLLDKVG